MLLDPRQVLLYLKRAALTPAACLLLSPRLPQSQTSPLLASILSLGATQNTTYLYGMCLLPLTRARMTFPSADNERQRPELPSRFLLSTFTQLPRSIRCKRLRPPDTAINKASKQLACASKTASQETKKLSTICKEETIQKRFLIQVSSNKL